MQPYISVASLQIPSYWLCAMLGFIVCSCFVYYNHIRFPDLLWVDITNAAALGGVGILIGAKLFYLLPLTPALIRALPQLLADPQLMREAVYAGLVFYGGLFGFILAVTLYCRRYHLPAHILWDFFAPCIPLFHAFGRTGCFLTGCCYGIPSSSLGIVLQNSISAPRNIALFPVQLLSAVGEISIFFSVVLFEKRHHRAGLSLPFYLTVYAPCRFLVEFLRGDAVRGIYGPFSFSQWISLILGIIMIFFWKSKTVASTFTEVENTQELVE